MEIHLHGGKEQTTLIWGVRNQTLVASVQENAGCPGTSRRGLSGRRKSCWVFIGVWVTRAHASVKSNQSV